MRGGTNQGLQLRNLLLHFNPPSPCGEGRLSNPQTLRKSTFQSTLPVRGGTKFECCNEGIRIISIHPPRAGRDIRRRLRSPGRSSFQSTLPVRGGTRGRSILRRSWLYFNPPSPCGEGLFSNSGKRIPRKFQSTLPVRGGTLKAPRSHC